MRSLCVCNAFIPSGLAIDRQWACALSPLECGSVLRRNKVEKSSDALVFIVFLILSV